MKRYVLRFKLSNGELIDLIVKAENFTSAVKKAERIKKNRDWKRASIIVAECA